MRMSPSILSSGLFLLISACASPPPQQALLLEAAKECAIHATIQVTGIGPDGRPLVTFDQASEMAPFRACYQEHVRAKMLASGRLVAPAGPSAKTLVPIKIVQGAILVPVTVNKDHAVTLVMPADPSKALTVFSPALVESLGGSVATQSRPPIQAVVGGKPVAMPVFRVQSLKVGDLAVEDFDVAVYDLFPDAQGKGALVLKFRMVRVDLAPTRSSTCLRSMSAKPTSNGDGASA